MSTPIPIVWRVALRRGIYSAIAASIIFPSGIWLLDFVGFSARPLHFFYAFSLGLVSIPLYLIESLFHKLRRPPSNRSFTTIMVWFLVLILSLFSEILSRFIAGMLGYVNWWADIVYSPSILATISWAISSTLQLLAGNPVESFFMYGVIAFPFAMITFLRNYRMKFPLQVVVSALVTIALSYSVISWFGAERIDRKLVLRLATVIAFTLPFIYHVWERYNTDSDKVSLKLDEVS